MKGFSLIELMVAIAISGVALSSAAFAFYRLPFFASTIGEEHAAWQQTYALAQRLDVLSWHGYGQITDVVPDKSDTDEASPTLVLDTLDDGATRARISTAWIDATRRSRALVFSEPAIAASSTDPCDPLMSGDWSKPKIVGTYSVSGQMLPIGAPIGAYPIESLTVAGQWLIAGIAETATATAPTVLFFPVEAAAISPALAGFDTASTSRIGIGALAAGDGYLFAGNAFGSASAPTCADSVSCAQVQVFGLSGGPVRAAAFSLPYHDATGASATVAALAYANGYLYIGLHKTAGGSEFIIADAHDPLHLRIAASMSIEHSVTSIIVRDGYAYIATDDSTREAVVFDVHDPVHPSIVRVWDAPGSSSFGYGTAAVPFLDSVVVGRSYISNAPEVSLVSATSSSWLPSGTDDIGTAKSPDSVRAIVRQDFLSFVLSSHDLRVYKIVPPALTLYAPPMALPSGADGAALVCKDDTLYVAYTDAAGNGDIEALQGS